MPAYEDKIKEQARTYLQPGEQIPAALIARGAERSFSSAAPPRGPG